MDQAERLELTREVALVVAQALSPTMETMARGFERLVALEERQQKLLEQIVTMQGQMIERQDRANERQDQLAEALGLIIERLRRNN